MPAQEAPQQAQADTLTQPAPIIYQVMPPQEDRLISDETIRLFIAELFGTIMAIFITQDSNP